MASSPNPLIVVDINRFAIFCLHVFFRFRKVVVMIYKPSIIIADVTCSFEGATVKNGEKYTTADGVDVYTCIYGVITKTCKLK